MYIIAGLGNPGKRYEKTRHNCGFESLDILAEQYRININMLKFHGLCGMGQIEGEKVMLIKPMTFMNASGECLQEAVSFYKVDPERELIVIYDDISLPAGHIRIRAKGSAGGHNGMKSIITHLGTENFRRIRIGIGEKPVDMDLADYVLSRFPFSAQADMIAAFDRAAHAAAALLTLPTDRVMTEYNTRKE